MEEGRHPGYLYVSVSGLVGGGPAESMKRQTSYNGNCGGGD